MTTTTTTKSPVDTGGSFVRIRTLNFAVEYAGIRVRETTTAAETISLVASKLRLEESPRRRVVMVYPLATERARRGRARWRVRTLRADEALLPLRRQATQRLAQREPLATTKEEAPPSAASRFSASHTGRAAVVKRPAESFRDEVRFYLHDATAPPLDDTELADGEDASGSESSDDERPPEAKFVADRQLLLAKKHTVKVGTLLKRSELDPNLWRRRKVVLVDDRLWYWRDTVVPKLRASAMMTATRQSPHQPHHQQNGGRFLLSDEEDKTPKRRGSESVLAFRTEGASSSADNNAKQDVYCLAEDLEYDRIARSRAASVPLASNVVTEITGKRDVPHGLEIATASRTLVFRCDSRAQQVEWLDRLREGIEVATQNEYVALAELIIADEQKRHVDAQLRAFLAKHNPDWTFDFADDHRGSRGLVVDDDDVVSGGGGGGGKSTPQKGDAGRR